MPNLHVSNKQSKCNVILQHVNSAHYVDVVSKIKSQNMGNFSQEPMANIDYN